MRRLVRNVKAGQDRLHVRMRRRPLAIYKDVQQGLRSNANDIVLCSSFTPNATVLIAMKTLVLLILVALTMQVVVSTATSTGGPLSITSYSLGASLVLSGVAVDAEPKPWWRRRRRRRRSGERRRRNVDWNIYFRRAYQNRRRVGK